MTQGIQNLTTGCLVNDMEKWGRNSVAQIEVIFWSLYGETEKHPENVKTLLISANIQTGTSRTRKHYCMRHRVCCAANVYTDSMPCIQIACLAYSLHSKVHPIIGHEGPEVEQRRNSTLSLTSALDGVVVNATPRLFYPRD